MKAVCFRCGDFKPSAWKRCTQCNYRPVGDDEKAKHLLLSTHFNNETKLKEFSEHIKNGQEVDFKDKDLEVVMIVLKDKEKNIRYERIHVLKLVGVFCLTLLLILGYYIVMSYR